MAHSASLAQWQSIVDVVDSAAPAYVPEVAVPAGGWLNAGGQLPCFSLAQSLPVCLPPSHTASRMVSWHVPVPPSSLLCRFFVTTTAACPWLDNKHTSLWQGEVILCAACQCSVPTRLSICAPCETAGMSCLVLPSKALLPLCGSEPTYKTLTTPVCQLMYTRV